MWSFRPDRRDDVQAAGTRGPAYVPYQPTTSTTGAILPTSGFVVLSGATTARTLAAPTEDGQVLEITSATATVFVITATSLIQDGVTGGAKTTMTFTGGFVGSSIKLRAYNGTWYVICKNVVAIT